MYECMLVCLFQQACRCINTQTHDKYTKNINVHVNIGYREKHMLTIGLSSILGCWPLRLTHSGVTAIDYSGKEKNLQKVKLYS